jgi:cytochrome c biogenesis protein CcdA/thiol-disulfide isomerase/thioredoxin
LLLFVISYLGGAFTILSPCILPVLPFVFARSDQPFIKSGLPLLLGMALTFAAVATLAAVGGGWAVAANQYGRIAAIVLLGLFGITLLFPQLADRLTRPLVNLGSRLSMSAASRGRGGSSVLPSFLLGIATGLLWAPCAGPILGLLLTGAALQGASAQTSLLLLAYALGAATSLALALLIGGRVFAVMKKSLGAGEWIRRGLGVAVLCGVVAIALGLDTGFLTSVSVASTANIEQALIDKVQPTAPADTLTSLAANGTIDLPVEGPFPSLTGAVQWLNSPPLTPEALKGKVVLVDFWTYSCINCLRTLPYVRAWAEKYKDKGLVVIGVHTPEFAFEKDVGNVTQATKDLMVDYPVAIDNDYGVWRAFNNQYWPAHFFIDANGQIRHHHYGEGEYDQSEKIIQQLLIEAGQKNVPTDIVNVDGTGALAEADQNDMQSPETYVGYDRAANFASPGGSVNDAAHVYTAAVMPTLNQWSLAGNWTVGGQSAAVVAPGASIGYRFHARDLHLVMGPGAGNKPVRFHVTLDGKPPGDAHGADIDADGNGTITEQRLYQLLRQPGMIGDRDFEITFLDPGAEAYAFTFG